MSYTKQRARGGTVLSRDELPVVEVDPAQEKWVRDFIAAGAQEKESKEQLDERNDIIGRATVSIDLSPEAMGGLKFDLLVKKNADFKAKALALFGKQQTMTTLTGTGDAMAEFDTYHDGKAVEPVDPQILAKATKSLEMVARASQEMNAGLMELYAKELGIDPKDFEAIEAFKTEKAKKKKRWDVEGDKDQEKKDKEGIGGSKNKDKETEAGTEKDLDELAKKYDELVAKVDKEVRDEVWQPLVRQGLLPENFVPDRQSEVSRTFEAASKLYDERLKAFTESQGDNAGLLRKLGLGKDVTDRVLKLADTVVEAVPGAKEYKDTIKAGFEVIEIVAATGFEVAGKIIQKKDALEIASSVATGVSAALGKVPGIPDDVSAYIGEGMMLALTGGRVIKGLMSGKPADIYAALGDAINQSLALSAVATNTPAVAEAGKDVAALIRASKKGGPLIEALSKKPPDIALAKKLFAGMVQDVLTEVGAAVSRVVDANVQSGGVSKDKGALADTIIGDGTEAMVAFVGVAIAEDKAAALAGALGGIAQSCFTNYLPGDYGGTIGSAVSSGFTNGLAFAKAVKEKKPADALKAFGSMASDGLAAAAKAKGLPPEATTGLKDAANWVKTGVDKIDGAALLKKAIQEGDADGIEAAFDTLMEGMVDKVLQQIDPSTDDEDGDDSGAGDEDADAGEEGAVTVAAEKEKEAFEKQRLQVIENAKTVIDDPGAKPADIKKAKAARDVAVKQLLGAKQIEEDVKADADSFKDMLNAVGGEGEGGGEDDGDLRTLESMIATIKRDRMILDLVDKLSSMGIAAAAHFFPPAGAAMDFKTFAVEAAKTVAHLRQLAIWMTNAKEARNAVTVQVHTMLNRVGLEEDMSVEHAIKATIALVSGVGNVIATAGAHAAPVGVAMAASAKVAGAALELALLVKSEAEMEMAWRQYQRAFKNPKDRKEIRMALQKNATLAKYGLVWGACKDNNPIAKKALKRCGLTDAIIAKESANENKVVEYLETLFRDDPVVLRAVPDMDGWTFKPPKPELTLRCWMEALSIAQKKAKLAPNTGGAITVAFSTLETVTVDYAKAKDSFDALKKSFAQSKASGGLSKATAGVSGKKTQPSKLDKAAKGKLDAADKVVKEKQAALMTALKALNASCNAFKPLNQSGEEHGEVREYVVALGALAVIEARELNGEDSGLDQAA